VGLANGDEYGARREDDGSFVVWDSKAANGTLNYYRYDSQSGRQEYLRSLFSYDTRTRPPYRKGIELKKPGWTEVYPSATGRGLVVTAVYPVYNPQHELVGVLGSSLLLNWMDDFLRSLSVTEHSSIYIISRDGKIIASTETTKGNDRQSALLAQALQNLNESNQTLDSSDKEASLNFHFNDEKYIMRVRSVQCQNSLDWLSVMIIPESDLTRGMNDFTRQLLLITLMACILGLGTGVVSARYIINPIIEVNRRAKAMAEGDFSSKIDIDRQDEIGQLVHMVNEMSKKLGQYFDKLREEQLRTKLLTIGLETSSNLVVILDADRLVWWVNAAFEKLLGYTLADIKGQGILEMLPEQKDPQVISQIQACLLRQREWRGEIVACSKDGRYFVDEMWITPILNSAGDASYYLAVGQDITATVKAREAILEAHNAKAKAEKLYSIGTMASGISHEINQPLNSIKVIAGGLLYMLRQGDEMKREEYEESLGEIHAQADRIADIVKHLRSFIRDEQRRLIPCDVNSSMEEALKIVGAQISGNGVQVVKEFQPNLPKVMAHTVGLEQIGVNLLTNAVESLAKGKAADKRIVLRTRFDTQVVLEIGNNGPGIEADFREKIFEPFASSKTNGENQGLGLALVRNTINAYGGTIELAQSDAGGVLFRIYLPAKATEETDGTSGESKGS
ncbi:MAG TPA: ATP-binding protein, partial [Negativicutes bacterium]|nr:ATP-binding protein [Negativicutes bacterium]